MEREMILEKVIKGRTKSWLRQSGWNRLLILHQCSERRGRFEQQWSMWCSSQTVHWKDTGLLGITEYQFMALMSWLKNLSPWASLVAQWLGVRLPVQGTRVRAPVWEDATCRGAARPVSHNYWACASGACAPQRERPWQREARAPWWRVAPARHNWRKPSHRNKDPTQPKIN